MNYLEGFDPSSVTQEQVTEFVQAKKLYKCPQCGNHSSHAGINADQPEKLHPVFIMDHNKDTSENGLISTLACFSIICDNCGNVRLFLKEKVAEWVYGHGTD